MDLPQNFFEKNTFEPVWIIVIHMCNSTIPTEAKLKFVSPKFAPNFMYLNVTWYSLGPSSTNFPVQARLAKWTRAGVNFF